MQNTAGFLAVNIFTLQVKVWNNSRSKAAIYYNRAVDNAKDTVLHIILATDLLWV